MKTSYFFYLFIVFSVLVSSNKTFAQNTVFDVLENTVTPSSKVVGTTINVSTVAELKTAINTVNSAGSNYTILIADGTYQIASTSWYPYITASNLVIRSASGNRDAVILKGGGMRDASSTESGFQLMGDNVTIADLTIQEVGNHGIQLCGDNILLHNIKFQNTYEQMVKGSTEGDGADNGTIEYCLFQYTAGIGPNWYIGGIDIHKGQNWTIKDNVFKNIISPSNQVAEHAVHFWDSSSDNIVERNIIVNCDRGIGFGLKESANSGGIIRNNMIYNDGKGHYSDVGIGLETSPNTKVYNNTIYLATYANAIEYRFSETTGVEITNNLTNAIIKSRDGGSATLTTNVTNAESGWFKNLSNGDLRLVSAVGAVVNKGTAISSVSDDIERGARPAGSGFDIGADEYGSITSNITIEDTNVSVYPNPATDKITIDGENIKKIDIINMNGQKIKSIIAEGNQVEINLNGLPKGIYLVKIDAKNQTTMKKIILK